MKKQIKLIAIAAITIMTISCQKNDVEEAVVSEQSITKEIPLNLNDPIVKRILDEGWKPEQVKVSNDGSFYVVGGESIYSMDINDYPEIDNYSKQTIIPRVVDKSRISSTRIFVSSSLDKSWETVAKEAIKSWNKAGSAVNFSLVTDKSKADIIMEDGTKTIADKTTFGFSSYPSNGKAGSRILINTAFTVNPSGLVVATTQKIVMLVHELGHTIGFRHTNWKDLGEPKVSARYTGAILVAGTTDKDSQSIMNGGSLRPIKPLFPFSHQDNYYRVFTSQDIKAIQVIYKK